MPVVPEMRIRVATDRPVKSQRACILYWMHSHRRVGWNFALQRAVELCRQIDRPLLVVETLFCDTPHASDRLHAFTLEGMADNIHQVRNKPIGWLPLVETERGQIIAALSTLAGDAGAVVTDDLPTRTVRSKIAALRRRMDTRLELVDSCGLLPLCAAGRDYPTAYSFRRFLHKVLPGHIGCLPEADPLAGGLPGDARALAEKAAKIVTQYGLQTTAGRKTLSSLPIDHSTAPVPTPGGSGAAIARLHEFLDNELSRYPLLRNDPDADTSSRLSPWLRAGHLSSHQVFAELARREKWSIARLAARPTGKRSGWWGMSPAAEAFIDQFVTWRELGYNMCRQRDDYDRYDSLPDWARKTLADHQGDPRPYRYSLDDFLQARTHDELWNAAQRQLIAEGRIQNYLRMLWGKKILEWSASPQQAAETMIALNDRFALDGQDPNSYSGIFWCLGRYDRAWGPERPIFGKVRYMSSENTARKHSIRAYLERYAEAKPVKPS